MVETFTSPQRSNWSGTAFPTVGLFAGLMFFRTDLGILYYYNGASFAELAGGTGGTIATFQWDANRTTGVSNAGWTSIPFGGTFTEYPFVAVSLEEGDASAVLRFRNVTKTAFEVRSSSGSSHAIHYFSCTPGSWMINSSVLLHTFQEITTMNSHNSDGIQFPRTFLRTPAMFGNSQVATADPGGQKPGLNFSGTPSTSDVDRHGTHAIAWHSNNASGYGITVMAIESTGAGQNSNNPTSTGSGSFKAGHKFEAGFFYSTATTGTITWNGAFSVAPAVLVDSSGFDTFQGVGENVTTLTANPTTVSALYRAVRGANSGQAFFATDKGFNSTPARRLV